MASWLAYIFIHYIDDGAVCERLIQEIIHLLSFEAIGKSLPSACEEGKTQYLQLLVPFPKTSEWLQEGPMSSIQEMFGRVINCLRVLTSLIIFLSMEM